MTLVTITLCFVLGTIFLAGPASAQAQKADVEKEVEEAKALYREANFTEAIVKLEAAIEHLKAVRDMDMKRAALGEAYLHMALSYFALDNPTAAKEYLRGMLRLDRMRRLDPQIYAPPILELLEEARAEVLREAPGTADARLGLPPPGAKRKGGSKAPLIVLGLAAVGGGLAAAAGGGASVPVSSPTPTPAPKLPTTNTAQLVAADPAAGSSISLSTRSSITVTFSLDVARPEGSVFCLFLDERDTINVCFVGSCARVSAGAGIRHTHPLQISTLARCRLPNPFSLAYDLNDDAGNKLFFQRLPAFYRISR